MRELNHLVEYVMCCHFYMRLKDSFLAFGKSRLILFSNRHEERRQFVERAIDVGPRAIGTIFRHGSRRALGLRTSMAHPRCTAAMTAVQSASQAHVELEHAAALDAFLDMAVKGDKCIASQLVVLLDYDLTLSLASVAECHHMLRDSSALPSGFRQDVQTLFDAREPMHPQHTSMYGNELDADRPHRFWMTYNRLLVEHRITQRMIDQAVAEEKQKQRELYGRKPPARRRLY